ncbi:hypothetical protein [Polaromonas sp. A23]|uniref:hypothetical protein n=1 Tax=Polaromonas sp. A23 TaxID=1944133 RepID=UPI000986E096|nr:hypothetical protein [Polaromonas sp. A23]OOG44438.1 hypothetical protein B0B52_06755 [Polaromonas sp. A23]
MEISKAIRGLLGEVARMPSQERLASERWQREFERMNAEALAKTKVIHHAPVVGTSEVNTAVDLSGVEKLMRRDVHVHPDPYGETSPIERSNDTVQLASEQGATGAGNSIFNASTDFPSAVQKDNVAGVIESKVAESIAEEKLRAILKNMEALPALWKKKNIHCELTKDGLVVWVRNAGINKSMGYQLARKLSNELESSGLHPIRIYLNGRLSYSGGTVYQTTTPINDLTNGGLK